MVVESFAAIIISTYSAIDAKVHLMCAAMYIGSARATIYYQLLHKYINKV